MSYTGEGTIEVLGRTYNYVSEYVEGDAPEIRVTFYLDGLFVRRMQEAAPESTIVAWFKEDMLREGSFEGQG